jgi:hypothetical protein
MAKGDVNQGDKSVLGMPVSSSLLSWPSRLGATMTLQLRWTPIRLDAIGAVASAEEKMTSLVSMMNWLERSC